MIGGVIMTCLLKTHKASLDAIVLGRLQTFHNMALDLVLRFLCDVFDTLEKQIEIEQISKRLLVE
jgi:hypothetical protein